MVLCCDPLAIAHTAAASAHSLLHRKQGRAIGAGLRVTSIARSAAFTVIVPIEPVGVAALGAHALSRWVPYQLYRLNSAGWPNARPELVRLISFVPLSLLIVSSLGLSVLLTWSALALLLWNVFRARRDIYAVFNSARLLDRSSRHAAARRRSDFTPPAVTPPSARAVRPR